MEKEITCKKCKVKFTTKIISWSKELHLCTNDINDVRNWTETRYYTRPQHTKCQLCRNIGKALDFMNKEMFS
jgi:hypothetical protein